jgi:hypothetical protein
MATRKSITVTSSQQKKRWTITVSGADKAAREWIINAVKMLAEKDGFQILNGSDPFGNQEEEKANGEAAQEQVLAL